MTTRILPQNHRATAQRRTLEPEIDVQAFDAMHRVLSVCMPLFAQAMESLGKGSTVDLFSEAPLLP
jgi:hypothetical protein